MTSISSSPAWAHSLCSCCEDCRLCCSVFVCQCNATGQLAYRTYGGKCFAISTLLWILFLTTYAVEVTSTHMRASGIDLEDTDAVAIYTLLEMLGAVFGILTAIFGTYFVCASRIHMRAKYRIPTRVCGDAEDCCVAYWCGFCSLVQMFRQDGVTGKNYAPCTRDGTSSLNV